MRKSGSPESIRARLTCPPPIHDRGSASVASIAAAKAWSCSGVCNPSSTSTVYVECCSPVPTAGVVPGTTCQVPEPAATKSAPAGIAPAATDAAGSASGLVRSGTAPGGVLLVAGATAPAVPVTVDPRAPGLDGWPPPTSEAAVWADCDGPLDAWKITTMLRITSTG